MTTLAQAFKQVETANTARDLFGTDKDKGHDIFVDLVKVLHPDRLPADKQARATAAMAKLGNLLDAFLSDDADRPFAPITIATKKRAYVVGEQIASGDIAGIYRAEYREDDETKRAAVKMPRNPVNNDLVENEARVLKHLADNADPLGLPYLSQLLDSFRYRDTKTHADRQINVLTPLDGFYTLAEVRAAYTSGLPIRDAAWMWKRLLIGIGHAHRAGIVHGAILPPHVLIHPEDHGLVIVDWCYAEEPGGTVKAILPQFKDWYPPEVLDKQPVESVTDIYMASLLMGWMLEYDAPQPFRTFIRGCALKSASQRPQDAWEVLKELDELLLNHVGPRRFTPFSMPTSPKGGS